VESLRPDAFVVDPLAYILAGPKAMAKYKVRVEISQHIKRHVSVSVVRACGRHAVLAVTLPFSKSCILG
jgi:hypothetical protein